MRRSPPPSFSPIKISQTPGKSDIFDYLQRALLLYTSSLPIANKTSFVSIIVKALKKTIASESADATTDIENKVRKLIESLEQKSKKDDRNKSSEDDSWDSLMSGLSTLTLSNKLPEEDNRQSRSRKNSSASDGPEPISLFSSTCNSSKKFARKESGYDVSGRSDRSDDSSQALENWKEKQTTHFVILMCAVVAMAVYQNISDQDRSSSASFTNENASWVNSSPAIQKNQPIYWFLMISSLCPFTANEYQDMPQSVISAPLAIVPQRLAPPNWPISSSLFSQAPSFLNNSDPTSVTADFTFHRAPSTPASSSYSQDGAMGVFSPLIYSRQVSDSSVSIGSSSEAVFTYGTDPGIDSQMDQEQDDILEDGVLDIRKVQKLLRTIAEANCPHHYALIVRIVKILQVVHAIGSSSDYIRDWWSSLQSYEQFYECFGEELTNKILTIISMRSQSILFNEQGYRVISMFRDRLIFCCECYIDSTLIFETNDNQRTNFDLLEVYSLLCWSIGFGLVMLIEIMNYGVERYRNDRNVVDEMRSLLVNVLNILEDGIFCHTDMIVSLHEPIAKLLDYQDEKLPEEVPQAQLIRHYFALFNGLAFEINSVDNDDQYKMENVPSESRKSMMKLTGNFKFENILAKLKNAMKP